MIFFQPRPLLWVYLILLGVFIAGEIVLFVRRRATQGRIEADRGFVGRALLVLPLSNMLALPCVRLFPAASFGTSAISCAGLVLMLLGIMLRWWSIGHLGRFFTIDVAIAPGHRVIESGPYRLIRHPSYSGVLLLLCGIALCFGNAVSACVQLLPCLALMMRRMRIEEAALAAEVGDSYRNYMSRTRRLIPGIY